MTVELVKALLEIVKICLSCKKNVKLVLSKIFAASNLALGNRQSRKPSQFS